jgi:hypothetical protein
LKFELSLPFERRRSVLKVILQALEDWPVTSPGPFTEACTTFSKGKGSNDDAEMEQVSPFERI